MRNFLLKVRAFLDGMLQSLVFLDRLYKSLL